MNDRRSANGQSRDGKPAGPFSLETVREDELEEIRRRRHEAELHDEAPVQENLIGLSLSGGGVRSGAFSLGVIQSLCRRGLLRFVDYLSTVSGGGYAGAYLTSSALRSAVQRRSGGETGQADGHTNGRTNSPAPCRQNSRGPVLEIAPAESGRQPPRMLKFIYGGHYLRKTGLFFNRYMISLFLIWTLVISGLVAVAALTAFLFRKLDGDRTREWIAAIGFEGDVWLAFFPSFVLLAVWVLAWGISYFRKGAHAPGKVAQFLFYLLVFSTVVAVAALLGTGDIYLAMGEDGVAPAQSNSTSQFFRESLRAAIFAAIGASLLPYLRPSRLMQSGVSEKPLEKYTFWIATRALVYGVPFVLIAVFAKENISGYNELRAPGMFRNDLLPSEWRPWSPFWTKIQAEAESNEFPGDLLWNSTPKRERMPQSLKTELVGDAPYQQAFTSSVKEARSVKDLLRLLEQTGALTTRFERRDPDSEEDTQSGYGLDQLKLPLWTRWWAFAQFAGNNLLFQDTAKYSRVEWIADCRMKEKALKDYIFASMNALLGRPDFHRGFSDADMAAQATKHGDKAEEHERWLRAFRGLLAEASSLEIEEIAARSEGPRALMTGSDQAVDLQRQYAVVDVNRRLVDAWYGHPFQDRGKVYAAVVLEHDQRTRWTWFVWAASIFLVTGLILDLNATSVHWFYGGQMALNWIDEVPGCGRKVPLSQLETANFGYPYHLISASINLIGRRERGRDDSPRERFLFSKLYCGSEPTGYAESSTYMDGEYTLVDAIAVSGAAVTPMLNPNPLFIALLFLGNLRLGQWIENPGRRPEQRNGLRDLARRWPYTPIRFLLGLLRYPAERRPHCFVTDGGHQENLGIEALLERRCRLIIASDAGQDGRYEFADLSKLVRWARVTHGIRIQFRQDNEDLLLSGDDKPLADLAPKERGGFSRRHFAIATIEYPESDQGGLSGALKGWLIYVKASMTGDEPLDLLRYQSSHSEFPHNSTADQFYDPERFESYRQLGFHAMEQTIETLLPSAADRAAKLSPAGVIAAFAGLEVPELRPVSAEIVPEGTAKDAPQPIATPLPPAALQRLEELEAWLGHDSPEELGSGEKWRAAIADLITLLEHEGAYWATTAKFWLEVIGRHDLETLRERGLGHADWRVQEHVADVIRALVQQDLTIDARTLDRLVFLATSERAEVASAAVRTLGEWHVRHQTDSRSKISKSIREVLKSSLGSQAPESVREAAFECVSRLKPSRIQALLKELRNTDKK